MEPPAACGERGGGAAGGFGGCSSRFTNFEGEPVALTYSGEEDVRALYQRLTGMVDSVPIGSVPSFVDVFGKGPLLVLKSDVVQLQTRLLELCREFARRKAAAAQ